MTRIHRICLFSLSLLAFLCLTAYAAGLKTPFGNFVWTRYQQEKKMTREETVAKYNYCPTSGCIIRLEDLQVRPASAKVGETLTLTTRYTILTAEDTPIPLSISRELFYQGRSLGVTKAIQTRNLNGTWTQTADFSLPKDITPGIYTLVTRISTGYGNDEKSVQFSVQ